MKCLAIASGQIQREFETVFGRSQDIFGNQPEPAVKSCFIQHAQLMAEQNGVAKQSAFALRYGNTTGQSRAAKVRCEGRRKDRSGKLVNGVILKDKDGTSAGLFRSARWV